MTTAPTPGYVGFARIFWMFVGPMILMMTLFMIATEGGGWLTSADVFFFVVLGGMIFGRWAEFHGGAPQTSAGDPATPRHLRRYIAVGLPSALAAWAVANLVGNYLTVR